MQGLGRPGHEPVNASVIYQPLKRKTDEKDYQSATQRCSRTWTLSSVPNTLVNKLDMSENNSSKAGFLKLSAVALWARHSSILGAI